MLGMNTLKLLFYTLSFTNASVFPVIDLFLSADADVHAQTLDLNTPFHNISKYTYNPDVLRAFITAGGDPLIENLRGETPADIIYEREKRRKPSCPSRND